MQEDVNKMKMTNGRWVITMILVPLFWVIYLTLMLATMIRFKYNKKIPQLPIGALAPYPCSDYGKRMKNYPKCEDCFDYVRKDCSITTLRKRFKGSDRKIEVLTTKGKKVRIS